MDDDKIRNEAAPLRQHMKYVAGNNPDQQQEGQPTQPSPEKVNIKIVHIQIEAESPLLPIKENTPPSSYLQKTSTATTNNNNNISASSPTATSKGHHHPHHCSFDTSPTSTRLTANNTSNGNGNLLTSTTGRKRSTGNAACVTPSTPPAPAVVSCRRRSSVSSLPRLDGTEASSEPPHLPHNFQPTTITSTTTTTETADFDNSRNYTASNNNNYSHCSPHHQQNSYPNDTFSRLEGKAPKPNTKMQTKVDAVGRATGQWGKWQLRTVLLIFLCKIPSSWFMACIIFTAPAPRHGEFYCKPPNTVGAQNQTQWIKVSHPQKEEADDQEFNIDFCNVYQDAQEHAHYYYHYDRREMEPNLLEEPATRNSSIIPCAEFKHQAEFHSVITQYDLVCSRDILVSVTQFFHLFGVLTGGILANHLLKYFSPRNVMLFGMVAQIFCGNMTGHVASYELHVFFRCLSAVCCAQMYTAGGMIMADITGGKYKTCVSTLFEQFWSIGVIMLPGLASFFQSWSHLYMAISWPTVILIYLWRWIPDSPRWMIQRGRVNEAKEILLKCVEVNGTQYSLPHDFEQQLQLQALTCMDGPPPANWWSIWKGPKAIRYIISVHLCWSIYIVVYYGMLLNIRSFSREHLEVNTVVAGCCEIIGTFIGLFLILQTERKWLWTGLFNVVAGLIAFTGWLVPHDISINSRVVLLMLSAMVSKTAISTTLSILTTCTVELVTDEKKKICAFSTICWARFWLLGAPFIGATVIFGQLVPQTAFASLAIIGGLISALISSPRTIPNQKAMLASNMTSANTASKNSKLSSSIFSSNNNQDTTSQHHIYQYPQTPNTIFNSFTKIASPHSNLPPELMPGIWTTKCPEDNPPAHI